jgi:two-component system cell cycle sensor histidine kinase/response regulator CckA
MEKKDNKIMLRVLFIEDSEDDALLLVRMISASDYSLTYERVDTANDMRTMLETRTWDIIISDYYMPDFSAIDAFQILKEKGFDIPFIIVSGAIGEETAVSAMKAGVHDYIMKDNLARLLPAINREIHEAELREQHRKEKEEKVKIQEQLIQAQKMEAIGLLTGGIAHDFNNFLTIILGQADLGILCAENNNPLKKNLESIRNAAEKGVTLTQQLLLFSRKHIMNFLPLNLNHIIKDVIKMLRDLLEETIIIKATFEPELMTVRMDQVSIEQVFMNLALNARDAMPKGGILSFKTDNIFIDEITCKSLPLNKPGKYVRIIVSDTGCGMNTETIEHIFDPFFTTKPYGKGTGLGLSVVYGIINEHSGCIKIQSELKKGSSFEVYLPAVLEKAILKPVIDKSLADLHGDRETILVVEDNIELLDFIKTTLNENNYSLVAVTDAEQALKVFKERKGKFNLLFSDIVLPFRNGYELAMELHKINPNMHILLTSGYAEQKVKMELIKKEGFHFIQKPYTIAQILHTLKEILKK